MEDEDYDYHQEIARSAFADMLHDTERNKKYRRALQLAIEKMHNDGKRANVLDIGTGTGLLSIMAAQCGADSIVACEGFEPMAACCKKILERNGVVDRITLIPKRSTDMTVGPDGDMQQKANILVTEVFDTELIGEGALSTFTHALKNLLVENCIVVPDSAVIYAQVVECPELYKWNKLNDLADEEMQIVLRTPQKMKDCAGSAAVHDLQLSQLPRQSSFRQISEQIPVFYFDWTGRSPVVKERKVKQTFKSMATGKAQMVFMWWELNMDTEGRIVLSCAPWWCHPDADISSDRPQDSIPWRDHWMQAVYYFPQQLDVIEQQDYTLISCHDEYSMWFDLQNNIAQNRYDRPVCECGVHMALSRTYVSYLNDGKRSKRLLKHLRESLAPNSVVLDLNGSSFLGLAAAKMGAQVYILEDSNLNRGILDEYIKYNALQNVTFISEVEDEVLKTITNITCDPNFATSILPWDNLKMAYLLNAYKGKLGNVSIMPESCEFWAMPVQFQDLHKIRVPLGACEGIDMGLFDTLVEQSRVISDGEVEAQPLWEYPCTCRGQPRKLLEIIMADLKPTYAGDNTYPLSYKPPEDMIPNMDKEVPSVNGFALWAVWKVGGRDYSFGPTKDPMVGYLVEWDMHALQGVKILKSSHDVKTVSAWSYQVACDLNQSQFNVHLELTVDQ